MDENVRSVRQSPIKRLRPFGRRFEAGICRNAVTRRSKICPACSTRSYGVGSVTMGATIPLHSTRRCANWIVTWLYGPSGNTRSCAAIYAERHTGSPGFPVARPQGVSKIEGAEGGASSAQTSVRDGARERVELRGTGILQLSCSPRESGQPPKFSVTGDPALDARATATQSKESDDVAKTRGDRRALALQTQHPSSLSQFAL